VHIGIVHSGGVYIGVRIGLRNGDVRSGVSGANATSSDATTGSIAIIRQALPSERPRERAARQAAVT
jgi:hypothetical protein